MAIPTLNDNKIQAFLDTLGKELKPGSRSPTSVLTQVFLTGVMYGRNNPVPAYTGPINPQPAATKVNPDSQAQAWMSGDKHSSKGGVNLGAVPIPMILHCPMCHKQHIDEPTPEWSNPPHKSHLCLHCGVIWRPAAIPTTGVRELHSRGFKDTWPKYSTSFAIAVQEHLQKDEVAQDIIAARNQNTPVFRLLSELVDMGDLVVPKPADHLEVTAKVNESIVYTGSPTVYGPKEYDSEQFDAEVEALESKTPPTFPGEKENSKAVPLDASKIKLAVSIVDHMRPATTAEAALTAAKTVGLNQHEAAILCRTKHLSDSETFTLIEELVKYQVKLDAAFPKPADILPEEETQDDTWLDARDGKPSQ